ADHPGDYGVVDVEDGLVKSIKEKPGPAAVAESGVVNAGAYRLDSRVFDELRDVERTPEGELSLVDVLAARARGGSVEAVWTDSWADVSHPWDLVDLNSRRADGRRVDATVHPTAYVADDVVLGRDARVGPNASVLPGTALGDNAVVGAGAVVAGSVVFGDARVGENAVLRDAVVGEGADVGPGVVVEGGPADVVSGDEVHRGVSLGGVVGDGTYVGGGARLEPGVVLGVDVRVSPGARVGGRVNSGTEVR
ncbi:MAG: sugar phosphate nucleotidyltransferase, partial [Halobacteriota archaeon]